MHCQALTVISNNKVLAWVIQGHITALVILSHGNLTVCVETCQAYPHFIVMFKPGDEAIWQLGYRD